VAKERKALIRASEIGEYVYCARAWWLRRVAGLTPAGSERRERGTVLHRRHGRAVVMSGALIWVGAALFFCALAFLIIGLQ
jgi:CRISPR/Cas system-associated exonuclease Cas4 (RecB family)